MQYNEYTYLDDQEKDAWKETEGLPEEARKAVRFWAERLVRERRDADPAYRASLVKSHRSAKAVVGSIILKAARIYEEFYKLGFIRGSPQAGTDLAHSLAEAAERAFQNRWKEKEIR